jgi:hypothetical protein
MLSVALQLTKGMKFLKYLDLHIEMIVLSINSKMAKRYLYYISV